MTNMDPKVTIDNHIDDKTDNQFEDKTRQEATASLQPEPISCKSRETGITRICNKSKVDHPTKV
jgi:hypothetical protein